KIFIFLLQNLRNVRLSKLLTPELNRNRRKNMANPLLRGILCSLLIWGSSLLVPHHLYAQTGWGTATSLGQSFTPKAQVPKIAMDPQGNAIVVWQQGDSTGVLSIWANRYDVGSGTWGTATL